MPDDQSIAIIAGVATSLAALILAWRAYRGAANEHERRKRDRQRRD